MDRVIRMMSVIAGVRIASLMFSLRPYVQQGVRYLFGDSPVAHRKAFGAVMLGVLLTVPQWAQFGGLRFEQLLFVMVVPFTLQRSSGHLQGWTGWLGAAAILMYLITHVFSSLYVGAGLMLLYALGHTGRWPSFSSWLLLVFTMPAFQYVLSAFSFPLRLWLTSVAGDMLSWVMPGVEVQGNSILYNDVAFAVAPACLGLNMLTTGFVFAVFLMAFLSKRYDKSLSLLLQGAFMLLAFGTVMLTNLSRIMITVLFKAMPDTVLHETIGLMAFVCTTLLPLVIIARWMMRWKGTPGVKQSRPHAVSWWLVVLLLLLAVASLGSSRNLLMDKSRQLSIGAEGYRQQCEQDGVVSLSKTDVLVYIKPPTFVFGSDHNPIICWRAGGYTIANERLQEVGGHTIYTFELHKEGHAPLQSAWWYSNGQQHSNSQWDWRFEALKGGRPYSVVNITAADREQLLVTVDEFLRMPFSWEKRGGD